MKNRALERLLSCTIASASLASLAQAQPFEAYASGLLHQRTGNALLDPPVERRLPVRNIGSSGQDGVEIQLQSLYGGGVGVGIPDFTAIAGGEIKIKHKGWDGTIKGTARRVSHGDGTGHDSFDFAPAGVTALTITDYDANGLPISTINVAGPITDVPWDAQVIQCTQIGCVWMTYYWWAWVNGKYHLVSRNYCVCPGNDNPTGGGGFENARVITPTFSGTPFDGVASLIATAGGVTQFEIMASDLSTFGVACHGVGQAHISEECSPGIPACPLNERRLPVRNIGSSGQDGVAIEWPRASLVSYQCDGPIPDASGVPASMVTRHEWVKSSWNNPKDLRCTQTTDPLSGQTQLSFDTADFANAPIRVTTFVGGTPTGGGGGGGGALGYLINTNTLDWILAHPLWAFNHGITLRISNLGDIAGNPISVSLNNNGALSSAPADEILIEVLTPDTDAESTGVTITASGTASNEFSLGELVTVPVVPTCPADVDDGSGTGTPDGGVTIDDLLYYLTIFENGDAAADVDDGSGTGTLDGGVTIDDLIYYLTRFEGGC